MKSITDLHDMLEASKLRDENPVAWLLRPDMKAHLDEIITPMSSLWKPWKDKEVLMGLPTVLTAEDAPADAALSIMAVRT